VVAESSVPVGIWRSVGHSHTAFFDESFVDELALALKKDPLALRRELLADKPRHLKVLETAARESGWGRPLPPGSGRGLALRASFGSIVAQVAEVAVPDGKTLQIKRVTCAIDCGPVVNPAIVRAQMESGIIYGLSAALYGEITISDGAVEQANFPDYDAVRLADPPRGGWRCIWSVAAHPSSAGGATPARRRLRPPSPTRCLPPPASDCAACRSASPDPLARHPAAPAQRVLDLDRKIARGRPAQPA